MSVVLELCIIGNVMEKAELKTKLLMLAVERIDELERRVEKLEGRKAADDNDTALETTTSLGRKEPSAA